MHIWRDIGVELSVGVYVLLMAGGIVLTYFLSR
jgi:hypothetical protein